MRVLVACECSGIVRDAFIARGHDAISCDLKPTERPGPHYQGDVKDLLNNNKFDMMIAHPPCTYLARVSGQHLNTDPNRINKLKDGLDFFLYLWQQPITFLCVENPYPLRVTNLWPPSQVIQPFYFGHPYKKATCLWLKNLPPLQPTKPMPEGHIKLELPRRMSKDGKTPSKYNRPVSNPYQWTLLPEHKFDPVARARTFDGIAQAMADQWSNLKRPYGFFT